MDVQFTSFTKDLADGLLEEAAQLKDEAGQAFDNFASGANSAAVNRWFDQVQQKADETAAKIAGDTAAGPRITPLVDEEAVEKVRETLDGLTKDVSRVGMNEGQRKIADLTAAGATPEDIARARELIDLQARLESFTKPTTTTDYAAAMEGLQGLYAQGKVTADQFANIRATAAANLNETLTDQARQLTDDLRTPLEDYQSEIERLNELFERNLISKETLDRATAKARDTMTKAGGEEPGKPVAAIRAGSQDAIRFAYDQARGSARLGNPADLAKAQLKETERHGKALEQIARNTDRTATNGTTLEVVDL